MHFLEAFTYVNNQIQSIVETSKTDTSKLALKDMAEMMSKLPKTLQIISKSNCLLTKINKKNKNKSMNKPN